MSSRKEQLKKQIAQAKDPLVRMQLGTLLNAEQPHRTGIFRKIEDAFDSLLGPVISRWPAGVPKVLFLILLILIIFAVVVILECMTLPW